MIVFRDQRAPREGWKSRYFLLEAVEVVVHVRIHRIRHILQPGISQASCGWEYYGDACGWLKTLA